MPLYILFYMYTLPTTYMDPRMEKYIIWKVIIMRYYNLLGLATLHFFLFLLLLYHPTSAFPPPPPVRCGQYCTVSNAYGAWPDWSECRASSVAYPTTEAELVSAVAQAVRTHKKIKVVTKFSHTIPKLVCPDTATSSSMFISTERLSSDIDVDVDSRVVSVDSGMGFRELIDKVEESGMSLVAGPYWEGVSLGGAISTGVVGSSWWGRGGALHDHVVGLSLVVPAEEAQGFAKVLRLGEKDPLLRAAKVSLGVLGVVSKVKLSLEPAFKRSITFNFTVDDHLEEEYMSHGNTYEFGDITWFPSQHTAVYRYDHRVSMDTPGDGVYDFIGFQPQSVLITESIRASEKALENTRTVKGKCLLASTVLTSKKILANGLKNNKLFFLGYPVIGTQSKMQTSGSCLHSPPSRLDTSCAWDPRINGIFYYETTAIFSASNFKGFVEDVKRLRDVAGPEGFCNVDVYTGFLIRYVGGSDAYLGGGVGEQQSVAVDINYYRAREPRVPRLREDLMEEVEQMAFFKHRARPHWAKNRRVAFIGVKDKYPDHAKFLAARTQLDPHGVFSSEWSDEVLFGKELKDKFDGCALDGECVCSEDRHCSPKDGYYCKPGHVYQQARVCRYIKSISSFN